ncbi:outer membrane protein [Ochrobactrum sp. MYb379]|uniref:outer membrane protein n=1 Tax=Ochrobactrum sp. MYb379 TaxID=2745275 RepID=UPI0030AF1C54
MKIKSILLATTFAFAGISGANAADAIVYEEPVAVVMPAPVFSWNGGYLGGQIGYGWGKSTYSDVDGFGGRLKPDGFLGGLYAGYNFDVGNSIVLGVDGDVTYNNLKKRFSETDEDGDFDSVETKLRWSGAVRARAGVAVDRFLPYIAGGVAFGSIKNSGTSIVDGVEEGFSTSKTHTGWTAGAGVDYAATDNVILRLEYRYTDYGHKNFEIDGENTRNKFKANEVRLGVAYKF